MGVWGKPADFGTPVRSPSDAVDGLSKELDATDRAFAWPRRNAVAEGGGSGLTSIAGGEAVFGGESAQ